MTSSIYAQVSFVLQELLTKIMPIFNELKLFEVETADNEEDVEIIKREEKRKRLQLDLGKALLGLGKSADQRRGVSKAFTQLVKPGSKPEGNQPETVENTPVKPSVSIRNQLELAPLHLIYRETQETTTTNLLSHQSPAEMQSPLVFTPNPSRMIPLSAITEVVKEANWRKFRIINSELTKFNST